tara:strand:- start:942 stop:2096 length:1155 start_codon:yes stop_codon:yes gene_type:complete
MNVSEHIVESYNIFLNSNDGRNNGQFYDFQFGNNAITTRDKSQFIRLNLVNFNMYKNWTDVNPFNDGLVLLSAAGAVQTPVLLGNQNYAILRDLAKNWADNTAIAVNAVFPAFGATTVTSWTPNAGTGINGTTNNICSFILTTALAHGLVPADVTAGNFSMQSVIDPATYAPPPIGIEDGGDSALLLGGDRVGSTVLAGSYDITFPSATTIQISGRYPAQRSTEPNVYVRLNPASQVFASEMFDKPLTLAAEADLNPSTIFGEIKVDTELVQYNPTSPREFFLNMYQKSINHLQVRLTDSRNRALPTFGAGALGSLPSQTTTGNRNFTMTIRVDIVAGIAHGEAAPQIAIGHARTNLPARFDSNLLVNMGNPQGKSGYGNPPGY